MFRKNVTQSAVAAEVARRFPYGLNSRKALADLYQDLPPDIAHWELEGGNINRAKLIFHPAKILMARYLEVLKEMRR